jgi:hypothetical protein
LVEQAKPVSNVSQACRRCSKEWTAPEIEQAVVEMAILNAHQGRDCRPAKSGALMKIGRKVSM